MMYVCIDSLSKINPLCALHLHKPDYQAVFTSLYYTILNASYWSRPVCNTNLHWRREEEAPYSLSQVLSFKNN